MKRKSREQRRHEIRVKSTGRGSFKPRKEWLTPILVLRKCFGPRSSVFKRVSNRESRSIPTSMLYCYRVRSTSLSGPRREGNSWESCFYQSRREKLLLYQEVHLYPWRIYGEGSYRMRSICRLGHSDYDHARQLLRVGCPSGWTQEIAIRGLPLNAMKNDLYRYPIEIVFVLVII